MKKKTLIYNICYLNLRTTLSNFYITLTDDNGNVIIKLSSGLLKNLKTTKKLKKISNVAMLTLYKEFLRRLKRKKIIIKFLILKLEGYLSRHSTLIKILKLIFKANFRISVVSIKSRNAHNGVRLKKKRNRKNSNRNRQKKIK